MFLYTGGIEPEEVDSFISFVIPRREITDRLTLVLTTNGGDAHSAYRMARLLQRQYKYIRLLVAGRCKSAGTLVAIGADEIVFGPWGELGPLDVQLAKKDELVFVSSGLDTMQAFTLITAQTYSAFQYYMLQTIVRSQGAISFKMASDIASRLATGLMTPLAAQIDPHRLGEVDRLMAIATAYGVRLDRGNMKEDGLAKLVNGYPSHAFIIDMNEAEDALFNKVTAASIDEARVIMSIEDTFGCVFRQGDDTMFFDVREMGVDEAKGSENETSEETAEWGTGPEDSRQPESHEPTPRRGRRERTTDGSGGEDLSSPPKTVDGKGRTGQGDA